MRIRKASARDIAAIRKLIREHKDTLLQDHLPKASAFFVAEADGKVIGCCALDIYSKRLAELRSLAVTKSHQGNGIARKLIEACMGEARTKRIYEVLAISGADNFFKKHGFHTFHKERFALLNILGK